MLNSYFVAIPISDYCKSTYFRCSKISRVQPFLGDDRGFSLYNPISLICGREIRESKAVTKFT